MKLQKKILFPISLIISSIVLLLLFQLFWLRQVYQEQKILLQKETDNIFQKTMSKLQDSVVQKTIKPFKDLNDSSFNLSIPRKKEWQLYQGTKINRVRIQSDSFKHLQFKKDSSKSTQIQVYVSSNSNNDSLRNLAGSIVNGVINQPLTRNFIIKFDNTDSLKISDIKKKYRSQLIKAKIDLSFKVIRLEENQKISSQTGIQTALYNGFPFYNHKGYQAIFPDYQGFILQKMSPQIAFSIFLFSITTLAFYWIYYSLRQQQKLAELKNDFISNVTHELKTPVTTVSVAIEALSNFNVIQNPELTKEYLDISKNELNRLAILVDKVLKTAVFENQGIELNLEKIDFEKLIPQILNSLKLQFEKYQAQISFKTEGNDFQMKGDAIHLTNVIYNLLDNALKYSPEAPQIQVSLQSIDNQIIITIQDNGLGIESEYQKKIFDKFFRVPTGNIHNIKGYGLGLSYAKSVIDKHRGRIEVLSKLGEGACFKIYLLKNNEQGIMSNK